MKNILTNDFQLDAIKDNFNPPQMGEIQESVVQELFERLKLNYDFFKDYVIKNSEYFTDGGKNSYYIKDVSIVIRHLFNIELI